jgi:CheY-like chemotaxis protein
MLSGDHRWSVLIVDDDPGIVEALSDLLADEGYSVASAPDGVEGLSYLRSAPPPCLILLDWMMPRCDGPSFRRQQREDHRLASIPVALMTADIRAGQRSNELGAVAFLKKPIALEELFQVVSTHCPCRSGLGGGSHRA